MCFNVAFKSDNGENEGGSVVRALARDRKVASSTPGRSATE